MFGYLGEDKLDVGEEFIEEINGFKPTDREKYVIAGYLYGSLGMCYTIGLLDRNFRVAGFVIKRYKVISKEVYEALTT